MKEIRVIDGDPVMSLFSRLPSRNLQGISGSPIVPARKDRYDPRESFFSYFVDRGASGDIISPSSLFTL